MVVIGNGGLVVLEPGEGVAALKVQSRVVGRTPDGLGAIGDHFHVALEFGVVLRELQARRAATRMLSQN